MPARGRVTRQWRIGQREVEAHSNRGLGGGSGGGGREGVLDRWGRLKELRNTGGVTDVQNTAKQAWEECWDGEGGCGKNSSGPQGRGTGGP